MKRQPQTKKVGIKVTLLKMISNIASHKISYWDKANIMAEFCHLGSNLLREEIEAKFRKSKGFKLRCSYFFDDEENIIEGNIYGTLEYWQRLFINSNRRPSPIHINWGTLREEMPEGYFNYTGMDRKDYVTIALEHKGRCSMDDMQRTFNYIFNGLIKKGILKIEEAVEVPSDVVLPELEKEEEKSKEGEVKP